MTLKEIDSNLIKSDCGDLPSNIIAIAIQVNEEGTASHSALLIGVSNKYYLFHYTSTEILLEDIPKDEWYFHKSLEVIPQNESEAFLNHCEQISVDERDINYGFIFDGSYYRDGKYFSKSGLQEFSTCVGFCLNVITGYLWDSDFINVESWNNQPIQGGFEYYFDIAKQRYPDLNEDLFKTHHKRIRVDECSATAYLNNLPITKADIDEIIEMVRTSIKNKRIN